ncbi:unnamed protein product, partial [Ectocarpus sp. 12 AP-2014]
CGRRGARSRTSRAVSTGRVPRPSKLAIAFRYKTKSAARELLASTKASRTTFAEHLRRARGRPVSFPSSTTPSTILVIPLDTGENSLYLGNVCRHSTLGERKALWKKVAVDLKKLAKGEKAYVSTHGGGHLRLSMCATRLILDFYFVGFD